VGRAGSRPRVRPASSPRSAASEDGAQACSAQMTRVCSDEVEYMGVEVVGEVDAAGAGRVVPDLPEPVGRAGGHGSLLRAGLAVDGRLQPVRRVLEGHAQVVAEFTNRSLFGSGVNVAVVDCTGFGGAVGRPFLVRNAKLTSSMPVLAAQIGFSNVPAAAGGSARNGALAGRWRRARIRTRSPACRWRSPR
jgi:hypothetical protein